jgi:hypothetical protein
MGILSNLIPPQFRLLAYGIAAVALVGFGLWKGYAWAAGNYQVKIDKLENEKAAYILERADLNLKITEALGKVTTVVVTEYLDRVKVIKEKEYVYRDQAINIVPSKCELSSGWVSVHDASARNELASNASAADGTPSGITDNQALAVVTSNYAAANANAEQLKAIQKLWVEAERVVAEANAAIQKKNKKGWGG